MKEISRFLGLLSCVVQLESGKELKVFPAFNVHAFSPPHLESGKELKVSPMRARCSSRNSFEILESGKELKALSTAHLNYVGIVPLESGKELKDT